MSKLLLCAALTVAAVATAAVASPAMHAGHDRAAFGRWMEAHGKAYESEEVYERRYASWLQNAEFVERHRSVKGATYTVGLNQFADLHGAEWSEFVRAQGMAGTNGVKPERRPSPSPKPKHSAAPPSSVDWRKLAPPIWNQLQCGSSPYFGAVDPVSVLWAQQTGLVIGLSMQQVIDCSANEGNEGCNGGEMTYTFQYIIDNKGICSAADYPYSGVDGNACLASNCTNVARITGFQNLGTDETALVAVVATIPVATAVDAECQSFQLYTGGVVNDPTCAGSSAMPDHGISVFGYGTDKGVPYWTLRNSWGASWGEQGYIRIIRGTDQFGLAQYLTYPTLTL